MLSKERTTKGGTSARRIESPLQFEGVTPSSDAETTGSAVTLEEVEIRIDNYMNDLAANGVEITPAQYAQTLKDMDVAMETSASIFINELGKGKNVKESFLSLIYDNEISAPVIKAHAQITMAVFDYYMDPIRIQDEVRASIKEYSDARIVAQLLELYPPGSEKESKLADQIISDMETIMYETVPATAMYCKGRVK